MPPIKGGIFFEKILENTSKIHHNLVRGAEYEK